MAMLTVEGIYRNGKVELTEQPKGVGAEARVIVTFLTDSRPQGPPEAYLPEDPEEREKLRQQAFAQMERGLDLGGPPYPKREEPNNAREYIDERRILLIVPLSEPSSEERARIEAGKRLMERLNRGIPFGGPPYPKREELYDRTYRFDGTRDG